ncbi:IARS [Mytilus edulis]|uniref:IARS n=1 Tax=Mytilus edulis TaxID=6550 RepID=A0A8S3S3W7_MYTED|nr:IARS [Mytilus edulis]
MAQQVPEKISFPQEEEKVQAFWKEIDAFKTSLKQSKGKPKYTFYDGPPFATGLPHYGHILAGTIKDVMTRWAHQSGYHVERRFGWDCHGLPVDADKLIMKKLKDIGKLVHQGQCKHNYPFCWRDTTNLQGSSQLVCTCRTVHRTAVRKQFQDLLIVCVGSIQELKDLTGVEVKDLHRETMYLCNSPAVRADSLRFKEEGVERVLKDVFLPWYNAYRFFMQNVERLERSPLIPFITEHMYQNLKHLLESDSAKDSRSVHFLMIPSPSKSDTGQVINKCCGKGVFKFWYITTFINEKYFQFTVTAT